MASVRKYYDYCLFIYWNGVLEPLTHYFESYSDLLAFLCLTNKDKGQFTKIEIYDIRPF